MGLFSGLNPFGAMLDPLRAGLGVMRNAGVGFDSMGNGGPPVAPVAPQAKVPLPKAEVTPGAAKVASVAPEAGGNEIENYIIASAKARGIDPAYALRVARAEGGTKLWNRQSDVINKAGKRERSYGPFQLYIDGGLGNRALAAGIDPRDPAQGKAAIDFALDEVARDGWQQWYGAKAAGIGRWDGVRGAKPVGMKQVAEVRAPDDRAPGSLAGIGSPADPRLMPSVDTMLAGMPAGEEPPPGTQTLPVGKRASSGGGATGGEDFSGVQPPPARTPVGMAFEAYKVNRTTRMLRGLSPAATLGVLTAIGSDVRALRQQQPTGKERA